MAQACESWAAGLREVCVLVPAASDAPTTIRSFLCSRCGFRRRHRIAWATETTIGGALAASPVVPSSTGTTSSTICWITRRARWSNARK